jgi:hypothetical protein
MMVRIPTDFTVGSSKWYLSTPDPVTLGTSNLSFTAAEPSPDTISLATTVISTLHCRIFCRASPVMLLVI